MFNSNEMKYPLFFYQILQPLIPFLLQITNENLYSEYLKNIDINSDAEIDALNEKLTKYLLSKFENSGDFFDLNKRKENKEGNNEINDEINYNKISFVDKYKPEYITAQLLYYYIY